MKAATGQPADPQDWRKKYFDSLGSMEREQQQFRAMESVLKRLAGRLCVASLGQSPRLDDEIKGLQAAIRRESGSDELSQIATALTDAIQALDQSSSPTLVTPPPATPTPATPPLEAPTPAASTLPTASQQANPQSEHTVGPIANDTSVEESIRAVLSALLGQLRRDPELLLQADALDAKLTASMTRVQLPDALATLADLVGQRIQRIERAKQEVEALLSQMVDRLDEIGQFVVAQAHNQSQSQASNETLNVRLVGEMKAMGESVEAAAELSQVRAQVRSRLDSITQHLREFRERETTRATAVQASTEKMQARVAELEAEASRLHSQLKDEQRLATIDALTHVPNRLAYEKRMEEELKRWQRFKQPMCVAVWDVDHFKRVNDTFGHRTGDGVLRAVAECLSSRIRGTDFLARYGGEEFVMLLCGTTLEDALRLADEIRVGVSEFKMHSKGTPVTLTISCGVTALQADDSAAAAFERADKALYEAKQTGRNRCVGK